MPVRGSRFTRVRDTPFRIPGWSLGYNDEISSHAAVRSFKRDHIFVMTSPEDRDPRSLDEEVTVGVYRFDGDEWEGLGYKDFDSVSEVLALSDVQLERLLTEE